MKRKLFFGLTILSAMLLSAFKLKEDILSRMDLQASAAQRFILGDLTGHFDNQLNVVEQDETDRFQMPYSRKFLPAIIAGDKVAAAKELCEYIRMYCNSIEFDKAYSKQRLISLPLRDDGADVETLLKSIRICQINISNYPNDKKYVAEQQQEMNEKQARLDKLIEKAKGPFELKKEWEAAYPADPSVVIRKRLQEYIALVATVDFNAKLAAADKYNRKKFLNPVYEKKSLKWKAIFRAGKEVNDAVTGFVREWLKGEIIAKEKGTMPPAATATKQPVTAAPATADEVNVSTNDSAAGSDGKPAAPVKEKKALLNKLRKKAKSIIE